MPDGEEPASEEEPHPKKRSGTVTLMLMAGCGALAYSFARLDPQRQEEVRVYRDLQSCLDGHLRSAADCRSASETALTLYPRAVPRYGSFPECQRAHGQGACLIGERVVPDAEKTFIPTLAGYVVGVTAEQNVPPQPAFGSACIWNGYESLDDIRYVTGSGALLRSRFTGSPVIAYGPWADLRAEPDALRKAVFGGFGQTGRACIGSSSRGFFGG